MIQFERVIKAIEEDSDFCIKDISMDSDPYKDVFIVERKGGGRFKLYINRLDKYSIENIKLALRGKVVIEAVEEIL